MKNSNSDDNDNQLFKNNNPEVEPIDPRKPIIQNLTHKRSLKSRRNLKLLKAMNEVNENPDTALNKIDEENNASKNSTASAEQNIVLNLLK